MVTVTAFPQSFAWWTFATRPGVDKAALARAAVDIGFRGIEIVPPEERALWQDAGLQVVANQGQASLDVGWNDEAHHAALEDEVSASIEAARANGIRSLIVFSGRRDGRADDAGAEATAIGLSRVAKAAEDAGVLLLLEVLNSRFDHEDQMCDTVEWAAGVARTVGSPAVKILFDCYHVQTMQGDVIRRLRDNLDVVGHVHTAGVPGRKDLDDDQELNYRAIARALAAAGYGGWVGHELVPKGEPVAALRAAYETCAVPAPEPAP